MLTVVQPTFTMQTRSNLSSTQYIRKMHRRIRLLVTVGVLGTAVLVGLASTYPLYRVTTSNFADISRLSAASQAEAVRNQLLRYQDVARQFSSRTEIRRALEDYASGEISLEEVQAFTAPRLFDAMRFSADVVGMVRLGPNNEEVARIGELVNYHVDEAAAGEGYPCAFKLTEDQQTLLIKACSAIWEGDRFIGRDVVFFSAEPLLDLLIDEPVADFEPTIRLIEGYGEQELVVRSNNYELQPVQNFLDDGSKMHFYQLLDDQGWQLAVSVPVQQYNQTILQLLIWPLIVVLLMTLVGTAVVSRTLRPLLIGVAAQANRLERTQQKLRQAAGVFRNARESIAITDHNHKIMDVNPAFSAMLGYQKQALMGRFMQDLLDLDTESPLDLRAVADKLEREDYWEGEVRYKTGHEYAIIALQTISAVRSETGEVVQFIHIFNDITELKQGEEKARYAARHDELTGLPNRTELECRLKKAVRQCASGKGGSIVILFLDLDKFKEANDTYGHQAGDNVLQQVARRLNNTLRVRDTLARLGGDEFVIMLESGQSLQDGETVAQKVIEALSKPFVVQSVEIQIGVSIGIAQYPNDAQDATGLLDAADTAMYAAKDAGRNTWRVYGDSVAS